MKKVLYATLTFFFAVTAHSQSTHNNWQEVTLLETPAGMALGANTVLNQSDAYSPVQLGDGNYATAWAEGVEKNETAILHVEIPEKAHFISIAPGYWKSASLFTKNSRPRIIEAVGAVGYNPEGFVSGNSIIYKIHPVSSPVQWNFKDTMQVRTFSLDSLFPEPGNKRDEYTREFQQRFNMKIAGKSRILVMRLQEVYSGSKWDDACISEIFFDNRFVHNNQAEAHSSLTKVYTNPDGNTLLIDTPEQKGKIIFRDSTAMLDISEKSADNQWVSIMSMPVDPGEGRIETAYFLFNTFLEQEMSVAISHAVGSPVFGPYFITTENGKTWLEFYTAGSPDTKKIELR